MVRRIWRALVVAAQVSALRGVRMESRSQSVKPRHKAHQKHLKSPSPASQASEIITPSASSDLMQRLELFLPMWHGDNNDYFAYFDRSRKLFWPDASVTILMDEEKSMDHELGIRIEQISSRANASRIRVKFNPKPHKYLIGHDRQQLRMFQADSWSASEYIGFIDTDAVFDTPVVEERLFENGRPIVIGRIGRPQDPQFWATVPKATQWATGSEEVMRCMSYFPVVVKRSHIVEMRHWFEKRHNATFDVLFKQMTKRFGGAYSQFNIMCQWLWDNKHDEYSWRLHQVTPEWSAVNSTEGQVGVDKLRRILAAENTKPQVRVAQHARYDHIVSKYDLAKTMAPGFCNSVAAERQLPWCVFVDNVKYHDSITDGLQDGLFFFEGTSWLWDRAECVAAQKLHYENVRKHSFSFDSPEQQEVLQWIGRALAEGNDNQKISTDS